MTIDKVKGLILLIFQIGFFQILLPHSGRTDSQGGHYNRRTGEYHFHHGMHAHDHPNGICPYVSGNTIASSNKFIPSGTVDKTEPTKKTSSESDNSYIIFIAIGLGFAFYHFMKYKNKKKHSNQPHKAFLKERNDSKINNSNRNNQTENVTCPSCKRGFLILRHGKFGPFLGCSKFPSCRYTKSIKY